MKKRNPFVEQGLRSLHRAVREELERKSKLGQYVIVWRNGRTMRILASEELALADAERRARGES